MGRKKYSKESEADDWWIWKEICDGCGKVIHEPGEVMTLNRPNTTERDLCLDCLKKLFEKEVQ